MSVHSVDELIGYLPYRLGHHPHRALVVLAMQGKEVILTASLALAEVEPGNCQDQAGDGRPPSDAPSMRHEASRAIRQLLETITRAGADGLHVFSFEERPGECDLLVDTLLQAAAARCLRIAGQVIVRGGRRWLPRSPDAHERVDGVPITPHPESPAILAQLVAGRAPLKDREALRALVQEEPGLSGVIRERVESGVVLPGRRASTWRRWLAAPQPRRTASGGSSDDVAGLLLSLADRDWRDGLIAWCAPGSLPIDALPTSTRRALRRHLPGTCADPQRALEALMGLARCAPDALPALTVPITTVVGCVAWHLGEGAIARDAFERALTLDPGYRLAQLGMQVVRLGIRPRLPGIGQGVMGEGEAAV